MYLNKTLKPLWGGYRGRIPPNQNTHNQLFFPIQFQFSHKQPQTAPKQTLQQQEPKHKINP